MSSSLPDPLRLFDPDADLFSPFPVAPLRDERRTEPRERILTALALSRGEDALVVMTMVPAMIPKTMMIRMFTTLN